MARAIDGVAIIQQLSNRLLAYAGVSTHGESFESTDCVRILNQVLEELQEAVEASGAVVTSDALPEVMADPVQLAQVFQHLIGNAINHRGDEPPQIHLKAESTEGAWLFSVEDNGVGMNLADAEQVFYLFSPLHTRRGDVGTGISLAVCKRIVERHGGRIWVESEPGKGCLFYFTVPLVKQ